MAASTSMTAPVRIVALGGLGEIGLNLMAIECAGRAIVIDCGVMFPDEPALGLGTYIPEMAWLERSHVAVEAVVLTHAHEDHIGALAASAAPLQRSRLWHRHHARVHASAPG